MAFIVKATCDYDYSESSCDINRGSSFETALVLSPDPAVLARMCDDVDELNILMDTLSRPDLETVINAFGSQINLGQMALVAANGIPTPADIEEYLFSEMYPRHVAAKYKQFSQGSEEQRRTALMKFYAECDNDGCKALNAILSKNNLSPLSPDDYDEEYYSLTCFDEDVDEFKVFCDILNFIVGYYKDASLAIDSFFALRTPLSDEWETYAADYENEHNHSWSDQFCTHDIVVSPFLMPKDGTIIFGSAQSQVVRS